jgi:hypothetical protein
MSYNTSHTRYKSSLLAGLDCGTTGYLKGPRQPAPNTLFAEFTATENLEPGDCVAMLRIPAGTKVTGGRLTWNVLGSGVLLALGDPFACARLVGPCLATAAADIGAGNANASGLDCGVIRKIGREGDGCGIGYTYTCETDLVVTNLYAETNATRGGWTGGTNAVNGGAAGGIIASGGTITLVLDISQP